VSGTPSAAAPSANEAALRRLSIVLQLQRRLRQAKSVEELAFVAVNEFHALIGFRQAVLFVRGQPVAISGLTTVERDAPFPVWVAHAMRKHLAGGKGASLTSADIDGEAQAQWGEYLPAHVLLVPVAGDGKHLGTLMFARDEAFAPPEISALDLLVEAMAHAWAALGGRARFRILRETGRFARPLAALVAAAAIGAGFIPVRESVLAPAEVVARGAIVVRAPLDGVVDRIPVRPNNAVAAGDLLLALDARRLQTQLEVGRKALETAEAELRQAAQAAVFDPRARANVPVLRGRVDQAAAEVAYAQSQLERVEVRAAREGLAIFDDANDWIGRPVSQGERIMLLADPMAVEIEIRLSVGDAITLARGSEVRLFLNADPQNAIPALLDTIAYRALPGPDGSLSFRLKAQLADPSAPPRIGLKGTAKLYGDSVPLAFYLFRRPLAALRQWAGL
jgi:hypothetical protein